MHHKDLNVWQKAMDLVLSVYETSKDFPKDEKFGLTNQLRRSAVSIPSNIAEGAAERSPKDYKRYLTMALGSTNELETQLTATNGSAFVSPILCLTSKAK